MRILYAPGWPVSATKPKAICTCAVHDQDLAIRLSPMRGPRRLPRGAVAPKTGIGRSVVPGGVPGSDVTACQDVGLSAGYPCSRPRAKEGFKLELDYGIPSLITLLGCRLGWRGWPGFYRGRFEQVHSSD